MESVVLWKLGGFLLLTLFFHLIDLYHIKKITDDNFLKDFLPRKKTLTVMEKNPNCTLDIKYYLMFNDNKFCLSRLNCSFNCVLFIILYDRIETWTTHIFECAQLKHHEMGLYGPN